MGPRGKFLFTGLLPDTLKAIVNQVAETHPTADSVSTFRATPTPITFCPGLHDIVMI